MLFSFSSVMVFSWYSIPTVLRLLYILISCMLIYLLWSGFSIPYLFTALAGGVFSFIFTLVVDYFYPLNNKEKEKE
jgi:hypothetical protein